MDGQRRIPGMPPQGTAKMGPLGARPVTPDKAEALKQMAEVSTGLKAGAEEPLPEVPDTEEKKPADPAAADRDEFDRLLALGDKKEGSQDLEALLRMNFQDSGRRRRIVEARCEPVELDFSDFVLRGEWRQTVYPFGPKESGRPGVVFRSTHADDERIIRDYQFGEYACIGGGEVSAAVLTVSAGLVSFADTVYPELPAGSIPYNQRKAIFAERLGMLNFPWPIVWDLYVNYIWFHTRIRKSIFGPDAPFR